MRNGTIALSEIFVGVAMLAICGGIPMTVYTKCSTEDKQAQPEQKTTRVPSDQLPEGWQILFKEGAQDHYSGTPIDITTCSITSPSGKEGTGFSRGGSASQRQFVAGSDALRSIGWRVEATTETWGKLEKALVELYPERKDYELWCAVNAYTTMAISSPESAPGWQIIFEDFKHCDSTRYQTNCFILSDQGQLFSGGDAQSYPSEDDPYREDNTRRRDAALSALYEMRDYPEFENIVKILERVVYQELNVSPRPSYSNLIF